MILCVENGVGNLRHLEHAGEAFRGFHGSGSDKDRLSFCVSLGNSSDDGGELFATGLEDLVVSIDSLVRAMSRDREDVELIDVVEFSSFCFGCSRHSAQLFV